MLRHLKRAPLFGAMILFLLIMVGRNPRLAAQEPHTAPAHGADATKHAGASAPEAGHSAGEGNINPMEPQPTLAIFTLVVFVLLLALLTRFAWKPLLTALHNREAHLEHVLLETERARTESERLMAEHRRLMAKAGDEVRAILEKARTEAQATAESIVKQAQTEADLSRQRAQRDIASARDQALAEIWQKTADMAVAVAGRVLSKELSGDDHRRLLDAAIQALPANSTNGHGGNS